MIVSMSEPGEIMPGPGGLELSVLDGPRVFGNVGSGVATHRHPTAEVVGLLDDSPWFKARTTTFFDGMKQQLVPAMELHKANGLWDSEDDWSNVTEHCLLQAARVEVIADWVGLPEDVTEDLMLAAAVHDAYKKEEIRMLREGDYSLESYDQAQLEAEAQLREQGFSNRVIEIAKSVAHESTPDMWEIIEQANRSGLDSLTDLQKGKLIMHYSDDYTTNQDLVAGAYDPETGEVLSPLEQRLRKNENNKNYTKINQAGVEILGVTTYEWQRAVGLEVERVVTDLVGTAQDREVDAGQLPFLVDSVLVGKIADS
jgi:hypothetical protein